MLPRKRRAPTLCTTSNTRKASEEPEVPPSVGTTRRKNHMVQRAWPQEMQIFLSLWLQPSHNSDLKQRLTIWLTTQGPQALEGCESSAQTRWQRAQDCGKAFGARGLTEQHTLCSVTLGQSITTAAGRRTLALGIKDARVNHTAVHLCTAGRKNSAHTETWWKATSQANGFKHLPLSNKLIIAVLFNTVSAIIKIWVHKKSSLYHYQEPESWPSGRSLKTGNAKPSYELC